MSDHRDGHLARVNESRARWLERLAVHGAFRVGPGDRRRTPAPPRVVAEVLPELADRAVTTVRLHPRYGDEPAADASKLGGAFAWPASEPWPVCPAHGIPFVTVLQLRGDDFPEMPFPPGADLFQMLWCPREHHDVPACRQRPCPMDWADPRFFWRDLREVAGPRLDNPPPLEPYYEYIPYPCRLLPERVLEYPSVYDLPEDIVARLDEWEEGDRNPNAASTCSYEGDLSVAYGTKVGGYIHWIQWPWQPVCECGRPMEHLLTLATTEWNGFPDPRWTPLEEQAILDSFPKKFAKWTEHQKAISGALWIPTGLSLGDGGQMQLFVCRHCGRWPIVPSIECH